MLQLEAACPILFRYMTVLGSMVFTIGGNFWEGYDPRVLPFVWSLLIVFLCAYYRSTIFMLLMLFLVLEQIWTV